jgi:hypothetical protein
MTKPSGVVPNRGEQHFAEGKRIRLNGAAHIEDDFFGDFAVAHLEDVHQGAFGV